MKKMIIAIAAIAVLPMFTSNAFADKCTVYSNLMYEVVKQRDNGVSSFTQKEKIRELQEKKNLSSSNEYLLEMKNIVRVAYHPVFLTDSPARLSKDYYKVCLKSYVN